MIPPSANPVTAADIPSPTYFELRTYTAFRSHTLHLLDAIGFRVHQSLRTVTVPSPDWQVPRNEFCR
jgi:hypothetical protein